MTEYIDKTEAMRRFKPFGREIPKEQVMAVLARIDEGIVRCGECKHLMSDGRCREFADDAIRPSASDCCSYGERSEYCEHAKNLSGDIWECDCFLDTYCEHQIYDRNPDGTLNIVKCGERSEE